MTDTKEESWQIDGGTAPSHQDADRWDARQLADRIKAAVRGGKLPREGVAKAAGIGNSTLGNYMNGADIQISTLAAIAQATGVRLEWLATGHGPMRPGEAPPSPPEPPPSLPARPAPLFSSLNMDRLADAYSAARQLLAARGIAEPRPIDLVRIMTTIYDELTDVEARDRTG